MGRLTRRVFARMAAAAGVASGLRGAALPVEPSAPSAVRVDGAESLRAHAAAAGLLTGCAVVPDWLDLDAGSRNPYTRTVIEQASILVPENAMKWDHLRPSPTGFDFAHSDRLMAFAEQHGQAVRGHNLCWHEALPAWFASYATKENAPGLLASHIAAVAGRYAGRMHSWDVLNEAIDIADGRPDGLRKSPWLDLMGPDYIEVAFREAAKADPKAKLTYNDYGIELDTAEQTAKRGQVLMLARRLHARGVPIHAIGIQSHLQATGPQPGEGVVSLIREAAKMGLEVYISEMDVNTHGLAGGDTEQDAAVAKVYHDYLALVLAEPNVKAVLTWGVSDANTWLNVSRASWNVRPDGSLQRPLPFLYDYTPAPAFFAMRSAYDTREPTQRPDIAGPAKIAADPFAPFAVPGSPAAAPAVPHLP